MENIEIEQLEKEIKSLKRDAAVLRRLSGEKSKQAMIIKVKINNLKRGEQS